MRKFLSARRPSFILLLPILLAALLLFTWLYLYAHSSGDGINRYGESYGLSSEDSDPDLIAAIGLFGVRGYVKKNDLDNIGDRPTSPEEAARLHGDDATIPLYLSDGRTVIGAFPITVYVGPTEGGAHE